MVRRVFVLFLLVTSAVYANAQQITYRESFDNNDRKWFVGDASDGLAEYEIDDGVYRIELKQRRWMALCSPTPSHWTTRRTFR